MKHSVIIKSNGALYITCTHDGLVPDDVGKACCLVGDYKVALLPTADRYNNVRLLGMLSHIKDDIAVVQVRGIVSLKYREDSDPPPVGESVSVSPHQQHLGKVVCNEFYVFPNCVMAVNTDTKECEVLL
jgi:hypothetical protein